MPLPLSVARPRTLAIAPPVVAAGALAVGAGLLWLREQLARRHFQESVFMNDYQQDALYRRPNYRGMTSGQIQQSRQLLDAVGEDAYTLQPGGVYLERRELDREMLRRAGGGGFIFIGPGLPGEADLTGWTAGAAAAALGAGGQLWQASVAAGRGLGRLMDQIWGLLNRPPGYVTPDAWPAQVTSEYLWQTPGTLVIQGTWEEAYQFEFRNPPGLPSGESGSGTWGPISIPNVDRLRLVYSPGTPVDQWQPAGTGGGTESNTLLYWQNGVWVGAINTGTTAGGGIGPSASEWKWSGYARTIPTVINHNGQPVYPLPVPGQSPYPGAAPFAIPVPARLPALPAGQPTPEQQPAPEGEPVLQPGTPGVTPATVPATAPVAAPALPRVPLIPGAIPTTDQGTLPAPSPSPAPTTPPDAVIPWPGATPTPADAKAPPATLPGIARKTGEIEDKLDQIGRMLQPEPGGGDYTDLLQLVGPILSFLTSADPAGGYEISSPCETGEGSPSEPLVAAWGPSVGADAQVIKRIDALAELLQHHKNLKQPSCKNPSPVGEVVTVQFEET